MMTFDDVFSYFPHVCCGRRPGVLTYWAPDKCSVCRWVLFVRRP